MLTTTQNNLRAHYRNLLDRDGRSELLPPLGNLFDHSGIDLIQSLICLLTTSVARCHSPRRFINPAEHQLKVCNGPRLLG